MGVNLYFWAIVAAVGVYAWLHGGAPERIGIAVFAIGSALTHLVVNAPGLRFRSVEEGILVVDVATFCVFLALALFANRFWPLWVSGLLGVAIVGHLAKLSSPGVIPWAYQVVLAMWSYPILGLIALGVWNHRRRVKRHGADKSWSSFWRRPGPNEPPTTRGP